MPLLGGAARLIPKVQTVESVDVVFYGVAAAVMIAPLKSYKSERASTYYPQMVYSPFFAWVHALRSPRIDRRSSMDYN